MKKRSLFILLAPFAIGICKAQTNTYPFPANGNVGIGTTSPTHALDVLSSTGVGPLKVQGPAGYLLIDNVGSGESYYQANSFHQFQGSSGTPILTMFSSGNVGIGTTNPQSKLHIGSSTVDVLSIGVTDYGGSTGQALGSIKSGERAGGTGGTLEFQTLSWGTGTTYTLTTNMLIQGNSGNVGIGTTNPDAKLTVNGTIHAKQVNIDLSVPAPDYVFEKGYKLQTLSEVKQYITLNKHLPGIPSAKIMKQNGINVTELNMQLLQKVEELNLYMIDKDTENKQLKQKIDEEDKRIAKLEEALQKLIGSK